jgi:hypothetical protein
MPANMAGDHLPPLSVCLRVGGAHWRGHSVSSRTPGICHESGGSCVAIVTDRAMLAWDSTVEHRGLALSHRLSEGHCRRESSGARVEGRG